MDWTLDTGVLGAVGCPPSELKKVLEDARAHHATTSAERAHSDTFLTANPDDLKDSKKLGILSPKAEAAKAKAKAKIDALKEQIDDAIDAACKLASRHQGNVVCTIAGHSGKNHPSGVADRVTVSVDSAPHVADAEED